MVNAEQIRAQLAQYFAGSLALDDFEDWFLANTWNAHLLADPEVVQLVHRIEGNLLDFSSGAIGEQTLREKFAEAIRPLLV